MKNRLQRTSTFQKLTYIFCASFTSLSSPAQEKRDACAAMASGFLSILVKQDNMFYIKKKLEFGFLNTSKIVKILDNNSCEDLCLVGFGYFIAGLFLENKQTNKHKCLLYLRNKIHHCQVHLQTCSFSTFYFW